MLCIRRPRLRPRLKFTHHHFIYNNLTGNFHIRMSNFQISENYQKRRVKLFLKSSLKCLFFQFPLNYALFSTTCKPIVNKSGQIYRLCQECPDLSKITSGFQDPRILRFWNSGLSKLLCFWLGMWHTHFAWPSYTAVHFYCRTWHQPGLSRGL